MLFFIIMLRYVFAVKCVLGGLGLLLELKFTTGVPIGVIGNDPKLIYQS